MLRTTSSQSRELHLLGMPIRRVKFSKSAGPTNKTAINKEVRFINTNASIMVGVIHLQLLFQLLFNAQTTASACCRERNISILNQQLEHHSYIYSHKHSYKYCKIYVKIDCQSNVSLFTSVLRYFVNKVAANNNVRFKCLDGGQTYYFN